jgi:hypothetical protein
LLDGFKDGAQGDANLVGSIFDAARHPVKTSQALYQFVGKVITSLKQVSFTQIVKSLFSNVSWPMLDQTVLLAQKAGYFFGYLCGFILEQVLSAVVLALVSQGVGAIAEKVLLLLRGVAWIAELAVDAAAILRVLGYWMEVLAKGAADSKTATAVLGFLRDSKAAVAALVDRYPAADKVIKKLAETWEASSTLASKTIGWLNLVNKMPSEAAERFVTFILNKGETDSDVLMARWLDFANGKRSVADAADAYTGFSNLSEGAADALVSAAETVDTDTLKYTKQYGTKYAAASDGDRVATSLAQLRSAPGDAKYTDEAIGDAIKRNADAAVVEMSNDAIEETASIETHVPCALVAALAFAVVVPKACGKQILDDLYDAYATDSVLGQRFKAGLEKLRALNDRELDAAFARMATAAQISPDVEEALVRALSIDGFSAQGTAEYIRSLDALRDGNGNLFTGLFDAAPTSGSSSNIIRVGNQGAGSIAEAFEPVAMQRLIRDNEVGLGKIEDFGRKIDVSAITNGTRSTIEADCFLSDGTFIDMKHSLSGSISMDLDQLSAVEAALKADPAPISRAWYVVSADLDATSATAVDNANVRIRQVLGLADTDPDPIRIINKGPLQ